MFDSPIGSIMEQIQRIGAANTPRRTSTGGGGGVFGAVAGAIPEIMANEPDGSVLSQYYRGQQQGRRIPGYQGNVSDMRTTAPDGRSAYVDDYGDMYYMDTGERVETRAIPEDLSQPMVGPNSAYGPYYELGPNGPYDTRDINDSRHPDNPNNKPQADTGGGGYQAPTQAEMREMAQQAQALREANDARTAEAEAELAPEPDYYGRAFGLKTVEEAIAERAKAEADKAAGILSPEEKFNAEYEARIIQEAEIQKAALQKEMLARQAAADNYQDYPHRGGVGPIRPDYDPSLDPDYDPSYNPYQYQALGLGDLENQIGYDPSPRPQVPPDEPYPQVTPLPQAPTQSAGYLRSTGEGGYGAQAYYDEINAYLANHSQDEIQQAMGTYGVSQEDVDAAKAYTPEPPQPQYARGGLSRMLRKVR